jgi:sorting and assembly machinery component 37
MYPVPQKYYVPRRIRDTYIPRLEAVGLWNLPVEEKVKEKPFHNQQKGLPIEDIKSNTKISQAFQSEKVIFKFSLYIHSFLNVCYEQVIVKARAELDIYNQLLSGKEYVFQNRYVSGVFPYVHWQT